MKFFVARSCFLREERLTLVADLYVVVDSWHKIDVFTGFLVPDVITAGARIET